MLKWRKTNVGTFPIEAIVVAEAMNRKVRLTE